jgi:hypothetical protein
MLPAAHAGGGDNDDDNDKRGDGNKQKVEKEGAGAIADCDWNDIEESDFLCIARGDGTLPKGEPPAGIPLPFGLFLRDCGATQTGLVTCRVTFPDDLSGSRLTCNPATDSNCVLVVEIEDDEFPIDLDCSPIPQPVSFRQIVRCSDIEMVELNIVVNCEGDFVALCTVTAPNSLSGVSLECIENNCEIIGEGLELFCQPAPEGDSPNPQELTCFLRL